MNSERLGRYVSINADERSTGLPHRGALLRRMEMRPPWLRRHVEENDFPKLAWEDFAQENEPGRFRFINKYGGPFSQRMELNRKALEGFIEQSAFRGSIVLADLPVSRRREVAGVNSDGSISSRRRLFWGQKLDQEEATQFSSVTPIPNGWQILIDGQSILDRERDRKSKRPLEASFVKRFERELGGNLLRVALREKFRLDSLDDKLRLIMTLATPGTFSVYPGALGLELSDLLKMFAVYGIYNAIGEIGGRFDTLNSGNRLSFKSPYEYIMPPTEVDRFLRGLGYLNIKGRKLVRLKNDQ